MAGWSTFSVSGAVVVNETLDDLLDYAYRSGSNQCDRKGAEQESSDEKPHDSVGER